jgi:hypothetical protein
VPSNAFIATPSLKTHNFLETHTSKNKNSQEPDNANVC